jgi:hypothetical protein
VLRHHDSLLVDRRAEQAEDPPPYDGHEAGAAWEPGNRTVLDQDGRAMTDLLDPPDTRGSRGTPSERRLRSLTVGAAIAGLLGATVVLLGCMAVALVAWYASDAGDHGTTRDALRVGTDGWLLAQGGHLHLAAGGAATITAVPLGLTMLSAYVVHRFGTRAAAGSAVEDERGLLVGIGVLSLVYGLVALGAAVLASTAGARPSLGWSSAGAFAVALVGGGTGMLRGAGKVVDWRSRVAEPLRTIGLGAVATVLLLVAASSVLLAVGLLRDLDTAANVLSRLHADVSGGLLYTLLTAAVTPNAVLLTGSYLLGPGFAVGAGTLVSPGAVLLGPVPAFPLLAALPSSGTQPSWLGALVVAPVLASVVGVVLMLRRHPVLTYTSGALRGVGAGVLAGLLLTALVALAGGAVGPGRMAEVGAPLLDTVVSATAAMGVGGLFAGIAATWWARRH